MSAYTWTGAISGNVSLAGNYNPTSGPPGPADTVNENTTETTKPSSGSITVGTWNLSAGTGPSNTNATITAAQLNITTPSNVTDGTWNGPATFGPNVSIHGGTWNGTATFTGGTVAAGTWNGIVNITDADNAFYINGGYFNNNVSLNTTNGAANYITVNAGTFNAPVDATGAYTQIGNATGQYATINSTLTLTNDAYVCNIKLGPNASLHFPQQTLYSTRPFLSRPMSGGYNG